VVGSSTPKRYPPSAGFVKPQQCAGGAPMNAIRPLLLPAALALCLGLAACVSGTVSVYPGQEFEPTDPAQVQVYRFFPDSPSVRIGEVEVMGATGTDWRKFQEEFKRKAASIGGQAVVIVGERSRLVGVYETPSQFQTYRFGGPFRTQSFYYPGTTYPQQESDLVGIVLRFPEGAPKPPPEAQQPK
jgi:hypothetical protein